MPSVIDGWNVLRLLGKGGMSVVYEVEQGEVRYAMKVFSVEYGNRRFLEERFESEFKLLTRLSHPGVVTVQGWGHTESGEPYFLMKPVLDPEGMPRTLEMVRQKRGFSERDVKRWLKELSSALDYLHAQGVIHRDVKLQNVFLDSQGQAVLGDFGVVKILDLDLRQDVGAESTFITGQTTGTRPVMGSYWYLPPEVRKGGPVDFAADWYALGVLFFRLITGMWYEPESEALNLLQPYGQFWSTTIGGLLEGHRPQTLVDPEEKPVRITRRKAIALGISVGGLLVAGVYGWKRTEGAGNIQNTITYPVESLVFDLGGNCQPLVLVPVGAFYLGLIPVTRGQWRALMGGSVPMFFDGSDDLPMTDITHAEVEAFCVRLSARFPNRRFRLPRAEEWCRAYREGRTVPESLPLDSMDETFRRQVLEVGWFGQDAKGRTTSSNRRRWYEGRGMSPLLLEQISPGFPKRKARPRMDQWMRDSARVGPVPAGRKPPNALGLYDMAGNVFEMVDEQLESNVPHGWCDTEYGFQLKPEALRRPVDLTADNALYPVYFGQPFTPGLQGDAPWGSYFTKMPNAGVRIAL